jgi:hypothetical protein
VNDAFLASRSHFDIDFALSDRDSHPLHAKQGLGSSYPKCLPEMENRVGFKSDVAYRQPDSLVDSRSILVGLANS